MKSAYEIAGQEIRKASVKELHDTFFLGYKAELAETIEMWLRDCSTSFVADIAAKALKGNAISEKQAWCMAYEVGKIAHTFEAWSEKETIAANEIASSEQAEYERECEEERQRRMWDRDIEE